MRVLTIFLFIVLFSLTGCDGFSPEELVDEVIEEGPVAQSIAAEATHLTNQARASRQQCGDRSFDAVSSLSWNQQLAEAALAHSRDMAANNYFDHTNLEDESPGVRITRTGYSAMTWGENIAAGYGSVSRVIEGWIDSPGHCANIMNAGFTEFAVAYAENPNSTYGTYWTMVLAAPR